MKNETQIICTIGPASWKPDILKKMARAGMNVARLNFSHGDHSSHAEIIANIKKLNRDEGASIRILQDLEGPRIRIGQLETPVTLERGDTVQLLVECPGTGNNCLPFDYSGSMDDLPLKREVFIDDGRIRLETLSRSSKGVTLKVLQGGEVQSRKGINIPDLKMTTNELSDKDARDIAFGADQGVDMVAQSFVTSEYDILQVRNRVEALSKTPCAVFAKIENKSGILNIDAIIEACDGIMVARGDLGISIPVYKVPVVQDYLLHRCCKLKKQAIVATQMLESMCTSPYPTRAEVSDIANAISGGTDYVMLSAETATGRYPVQAVEMMSRIATYTEQNTFVRPEI